MQEELISFETAKLAKEKGYNVDCKDYWTTEYGNKPIITNGIEYESERDCHFDWNLNNEYSKKIQAPYPNRYHESQCSAPTQSLLQKWLREVHNIEIWATPYLDDEKIEYNHAIVNRNVDVYDLLYSAEEYKTYEEALEAGLQEALKLIK